MGKLEALITTGYKYWIGLYRTFKRMEAKSGNDSICLAVTKYNGHYYLDPDNCTAEKRLVCRRGNQVTSISVSRSDSALTQEKIMLPATASHDSSFDKGDFSSVSVPNRKPRSGISTIPMQFSTIASPNYHVECTILLCSLISTLIFIVAIVILLLIYKKKCVSSCQRKRNLKANDHSEDKGCDKEAKPTYKNKEGAMQVHS